ncbi:MAG: signal peptidase II [Acidimicrobiia bacterium]|nr:signal peptidase II [Acidimicrobiia bacterium]MDX2467922.1 signal peptidase II [Acidimicrobiia bacterium]
MKLFTKHLERTAGLRLALGVGLGLLAVDQLSKNYARDLYQDGPVEVIGDWLRFTYAKNPGAAFSSFAGSGRVIGLIAIGVTVFILYMIARTTRRVELVALGLILGGALGNLSDRIFRGDGFLDGAVVDWIDWWFIPTFNIADAALNVGVALLLISALFLGSAHE